MTLSLLCETVTGRTTAELVTARDAATAGDMVELRLDGVTGPDVAQALSGRGKPVIVTCRPVWEGGTFDGSEEERQRILAQALALGAEYVDVEWRAVRESGSTADFQSLLRTDRSRVVVSSHDFSDVPGDLCGRARAMRSLGAAVIKVAVAAARLSDTLPLLEIARGGDAVVVGMGDAGVPTRLLATRFGSRWTYAGEGVAPGQVPAARMLERFRFRAVGRRTAVYGVVGDNVMHSRSPAMHNAAFAAADLDAVYVPLRAADFDDFLAFAAALDVVGASITIPFKRDALTATHAADGLTRQVGAANTLRRTDAGWEATNTDVAGFLEPLDALLAAIAGNDSNRPGVNDPNDPNDPNANDPNAPNVPNVPNDLSALRASVLGSGGVARAVIVALRSRAARIAVHARRREQAEELARSFGVSAGPWPPAPASWDLLVNCTPLGSASAPDVSPLPAERLDGRIVYDLTYPPRRAGRGGDGAWAGEAPLLRDARRAGCLTLDGLAMLVAQAERQFAWWTGRRPPAGVMRAAADDDAGHGDAEARRTR